METDLAALFPTTVSTNVRSMATELQTHGGDLTQKLCIVFDYAGPSAGRLIAIIPSLTIGEQTKNLLIMCAEAAESDGNVKITDIIIIQESAWLAQLYEMMPLAEEAKASFEAPPIFGKKPELRQLFDAIFIEAPPTPEEISKWLKKKLITPAANGYELTARGFKAIRFQSKIHWRPIRERAKIGNRTLHIIAA